MSDQTNARFAAARLRNQEREFVELAESGVAESTLLEYLDHCAAGQPNAAQVLYRLIGSLVDSMTNGRAEVAADVVVQYLSGKEQPPSSSLTDFFFNEHLEAFSRALDNPADLPAFHAFIPALPLGGPFTDRICSLYRLLLTEFADWVEDSAVELDTIAFCWDSLPISHRTTEFVQVFCEVFSLPAPNTSLGDTRYVLETICGIGGMGIVYRAAHRDGYLVAVKVMRPDAAENRSRFELEARSTVQLTHTNLIHVRDTDLEGDLPYFTMYYVENGYSLSDLVEGRVSLRNYPSRDSKTGLQLNAVRDADKNDPQEETWAYLVSLVADAVDILHNQSPVGFVHSDLKPSNVLLDARGPKVSDLGLALPLSNNGQTEPTQFAGTLAYCSPEQARRDSLTTASDVYQIGGILLRGLTGQPPNIKQFNESDEVFLNRVGAVDRESVAISQVKVSRPLSAIIAKSLEQDPAKRYQKPSEMADDLRLFLGGQPTRAQSFYTLRYGCHQAFGTAVGRIAILTLTVAICLLSYLTWSRSGLVDGVLATQNRYRTTTLVKPQRIRFGKEQEWKSPNYDNVRIFRSSVFYDLSLWQPVPANLDKQTAGRIEPALSTKVIELRRKNLTAANQKFEVAFQSRTTGFEIDLNCPSHPFDLRGSNGHVDFVNGTALVREIVVDVSEVTADELASIVINATSWNGFQENALGKQWLAFLSPDDLTEGELAIRFPNTLVPDNAPTLFEVENIAGAEPRQLVLDSSTFSTSRDGCCWVWRPDKPRRNFVYRMEFDWQPSTSKNKSRTD